MSNVLTIQKPLAVIPAGYKEKLEITDPHIVEASVDEFYWLSDGIGYRKQLPIDYEPEGMTDCE